MKGLILLNGKIHTLNKNQPQAQALATWDSKLLAVGKNEEVKSLKSDKFELIDLRGKTVLPGFVDCHTHFLYFASTLDTLDLREVRTFESLKSKIKEKLKNLKPGDLLFVKGWDKNIFKDQPIFKKETLDKISPQNPLAIFSKDQHTFWANYLTLKIAEVDKKRENFPPEQIETDRHTGELTGILRENACDLILETIKKLNPKGIKRKFEQAVKIAHKNGLVGIHDLGGENTLKHYQDFLFDNKLSLRVFCMIPQRSLDSVLQSNLRTGFGNEHLRIGGVKLYADGALGSQTALTFKPYRGSTKNYGIEILAEKDLILLVKKANDRNISVAIHAIGDRAVHQALNALEKSGKKSLRNRIEHIQLIHPKDLKRFAQLKIIASVQPIHATSDREMAERFWGKRCKLAYSYKTLLRNGAKLIFGSDMPIENLSPLKGIHAAVTRKKEKDKKESWYPEQRVSVYEAVCAYTLGAAYASYEEQIKGSIQAGKLADLVILSQDIFHIVPEEIPQVKISATIFDGKFVYGRDNLEDG